MARTRRPAAPSQRKAICLCCRRRLHPSTVWRHAQAAGPVEALQNANRPLIPPSYPRASTVLRSRRRGTPEGDEVAALAQDMADANLSDHSEEDEEEEEDLTYIGDLPDDDLNLPLYLPAPHQLDEDAAPLPPPHNPPVHNPHLDAPVEPNQPHADDDANSSTASTSSRRRRSSTSSSSSSSSSSSNNSINDQHDDDPDGPRYREIEQLIAGWRLQPLDALQVDDVWRLEANRLRVQQGMPVESAEYRMVKAYKLQMETNTGARTFAKWRYTFRELDLPSLKSIRREMANISGLEPVTYHCCRNVCICFAGQFANRNDCPKCLQPRYRPNGSPANTFQYIPLTPQLKALFAGRTSARSMRHRARHHDDHTNNVAHPINDIYDSELYRSLRTQHVVVDDRLLPHKYFDDPRDVCLTKLTDGFQIFKRSNKTCWPLLLLNDNLGYHQRFRLSNVICVGIIPGSNKPKHFDSFLFPLTQELNQLAIGVRAYDALDDTMFTLRAYAPFGCGDMPACAAAFTGGKHPGAKHPCRCCPIEGIRILGTRNQSHYLPIDRPAGYPEHEYTFLNLPPLRNHDQYLAQAREVDMAVTEVESKRLSQLYGINGTPITANIPGVQFPWSYPFDLMHLLEGTLKNYLLLFTGNFKGLDAGREDYIFPLNIQKEMAASVVAANKTIPAAFGRPIPNFVEERSFFTAEAYLVFSTLIAPIIFRGRFTRPKYYRHFCLFISIVNRLIAWSSTAADRAQLRTDIVSWAKEYEDVFYQRNAERLTTCISTVHAWLHSVDSLEKSGPGPAFWCWVCERVCGHFARAVSSRKHPYASLARRALEEQTLAMIRNSYDLQCTLPVYTRMADERPRSWFFSREYPDITLLDPRRKVSLSAPGLASLRTRIAAHLATQLNRPANVVKAHLPADMLQYGRLQIKAGDLVHSNNGALTANETRRDATFIQYEQLVDRHARFRRRAPEFVGETFFGQLERIILLYLPAAEALGTGGEATCILLDVHSCRARKDQYGFYEYTNFGPYEVISGNSIRSVVGRIFDRGKWVFIQRHDDLDHAEYVGGDDD